MHTAFLGLGAIGHPMAQQLANKGFTLTVWNRTPQRVGDLATIPGVRAAPSPVDAIRTANVVITCLPTSQDVEELLRGPNGFEEALRPGMTLVDCTSGDPATSRRIAERLHARGIGFLDAPVSGGVAGAIKGTLTVMVGGDAETLAHVRPVLEAFGERIVHCGGVGAGDAVKAVNNAMLAVHVWSTAEGLATLAKMGVDPQVALEIINVSSGRSNASMNLFPERVMTRAFPRTFRLALLEKDIGIAAGMARDLRMPAPLTQLVADLFTVARGELGEVADHVEAVKLLEQWAGVEIQ